MDKLNSDTLPIFLREFVAYHLRVRFVAQKDVAFQSKWYFLPRFALGNALKKSQDFSHLYTTLFKPQATEHKGELESSSSRLVIRVDKPYRHNLTQQEPVDLYITVVSREESLVKDFLQFLPEWQDYNFFQEHTLRYKSYQLLNAQNNKYENELPLSKAKLGLEFFRRHAPQWSETLAIRFLTPTTLKIDQIFTDYIPFSRLMNRVSRRLYDLYIQESAPSTPSLAPFIFEEKDDQLLSQISIPHKPTIKEKRQYDMSGILGQLYYQTSYHPIAALMLSMAHWVHIGNHTVVGNGQIIAEQCDTSLYQTWLSSIAQDTHSPLKKAELENLLEALHSLSYIPSVAHAIHIPKSDGSYRTLSIPSPIDLYLQRNLINVLYPIIDKTNSPQSYAYRKGKGALEAIKQVELLKRKLGKKYYVVRCDIDNFFDSIPIEQLMGMFQNITRDPLLSRMVRLWIKSGVVDNKSHFHPHLQGLPQGSPLSPLLSNFYLTDTDRYISNNITEYFIRYADDILLFIPEHSDPLSSLQALSNHLKNQKKLSLNKDFIVTEINSEFSFLGISFSSEGQKEMSKNKKEKLERKISMSLYQDPVEFSALEKSIKGISQYYKKLVSKVDVEFIDEKAASVYTPFIARIENKAERKKAIEKLSKVGFLSPSKGKYLLQKGVNKWANSITSVPRVDKETTVLKKQFKKYLREQEDIFDFVVSEAGAFIGLNRNYLVVKKFGNTICKHPAHQVEQISIIAPGVSFSSHVTNYCHKKNIRIIYYKATGEAYASVGSMNSILPSHMKAQMSLPENRIREFSSALVHNKIKNQTKLLKYYQKYFRKEEELCQYLQQSIEQLNAIEKLSISGNTVEQFRQNAMLIEARGAKIYWNAFALLIQRTGHIFDGRVQQGASDIVNQMLNYGYAILQSYVMRTIDLWQLNPNIGILHSTQDNKPALCFDLMEQYRSFVVDRSILALLSKKEEVRQEKSGLLDIQTRTRIISKIKERWCSPEYFRTGQKTLSEIMTLQTKNVRDFCLKKENKIKFYTPKW
ncbi:CRISPR-associated protein Cas1 [Porphyromonas gingivicanis]|uniref:CRISPR-associated endonuclease Cas1 n=1 Tax=Porphyromonas gingivicanis TaxID=266762 RepID=A0A0A2G491_9PORP|nr:CRISPR-associated endonuclease Cas1 [Porphyromonas gingivicanis]KGN97180.1 CRISPR-associated protein Cas1 [Porphyromonas gingivicanis]